MALSLGHFRAAQGQTFKILHSFSGGAGDGAYSYGSLALNGSMLYGMTNSGGTNDVGTIFRLGTDGSGFGVLHSFAIDSNDGFRGADSLTLNESTLYGMTEFGGSSDTNDGTIFQVGTDGGFGLMHSFPSGSGDGRIPFGSLTRNGSTLYGMTFGGGNGSGDGNGTIFKIGMNGSGYSVLHSFAGGSGDGQWPYGGLVLSGSMLYGMTYVGGSNNTGTLFKIGTDGGGFSVLHSFAGGSSDGAHPKSVSSNQDFTRARRRDMRLIIVM
jgi:uncharacterized repeat protein (TIGR03803 family)